MSPAASKPKTDAPRSCTIRWLSRIDQVPSAAWNALVGAGDAPFLEWEWLRQLERSGCASASKGWHPRHLTLWEGKRLVAAAPLYLKTHSDGEFVFDAVWAELAIRLGLRYYPKLVGMSPFTPLEGYRFLLTPDYKAASLNRMLLEAIDRLALEQGLSGVSFLFAEPSWSADVSLRAFIAWQHPGFVWENRACDSFDDYLKPFKTNQRRNIRRERRRMKQQGLVVHALSGDQIPPEFAKLMHRCYLQTNARYGPWAAHYLNRGFFEGIFTTCRKRLLLMSACEAKRPDACIGAALLLTKGERLYGRYWGSLRHADALHFNLCYYGPIDWAIGRGIRVFDPGLGGHHKVRRGFRATGTFSWHRFYDPRLHRLVQHYIDQLNVRTNRYIEALQKALPFASKDGAESRQGTSYGQPRAD
jgi:predicted N-acyltransferase